MSQSDATKINTFLVNKFWRDAVCTLSDQQAGALFKALFDYADGGAPEFEDSALMALYRVMARSISKHAHKYLKKEVRIKVICMN